MTIEHEHREMLHYRRLAFRFLAFGRGISPVMATLGIACESRLAALRSLARTSDLPLTRPTPARDESVTLIDDSRRALSSLRRAKAHAARTLRLMQHLQTLETLPALRAMLPGVIEGKRAECDVLRAMLIAQRDTAAPSRH